MNSFQIRLVAEQLKLLAPRPWRWQASASAAFDSFARGAIKFDRLYKGGAARR